MVGKKIGSSYRVGKALKTRFFSGAMKKEPTIIVVVLLIGLNLYLFGSVIFQISTINHEKEQAMKNLPSPAERKMILVKKIIKALNFSKVHYAYAQFNDVYSIDEGRGTLKEREPRWLEKCQKGIGYYCKNLSYIRRLEGRKAGEMRFLNEGCKMGEMGSCIELSLKQNSSELEQLEAKAKLAQKLGQDYEQSKYYLEYYKK